jgi:peptidyl-dipeptidase Dcp
MSIGDALGQDACMALDAANPLASTSTLPFELPDYAAIGTAHYRPAIETGMAEQLAELAAVATDPALPTVANVIEAWEASGQLLTRALKAFQARQQADTDDELDAVEAAVAPQLAAHADAIRLDRALYDRVLALADRRDSGEVVLDAEDTFWLERTLLTFRRAGVDLDASDQAVVRGLNGGIARLQSSFERTSLAGRLAGAVLVTDVDELEGLSEAEVEGARERAAASGHAAGWLLPLDNPSGQQVLGSLVDRGLRERIHRASVGRGLGGEHDTRALVVELVRCRAQRAALLGFDHHAAYVSAEGCAGTSGAVWDLLTGLGSAAVAAARAEAADLEAVWRRIEPEAPLAAWDRAYVSQLLSAERYALRESDIRPYLELDRVLHDGAFAAATGLYGLTFSERTDLPAYNPDVRFFEAAESDGTPVGLVLADVHTRGGKMGGAWSDTLVDQNHLLGQRPVVVFNLNLARPATGQPTLMSWEEVTTLFHEFGHVLHSLLSDTRYRSRSGTETPRDFVEYPSQMNEHWALEPTLLARFAVHHETGEPMPTEWVDRLRSAALFQQGYKTTEAVAAALLDQVWHSTPLDELPTGADQVSDFEAAALARVGMNVDLVPPRYRSTYFGHAFGSWGYDGRYYSYVWSQVLAADTAAFFTTNGGLSRDNGERFRRRLLAHGGSIDVMDAYRDYRGRDPDPTHLLERLGLG